MLQIDETQKEKWLKKQEAGTYTDLSTIKDGYLPGVVILGNSNYSDFNWIQSATFEWVRSCNKYSLVGN